MLLQVCHYSQPSFRNYRNLKPKETKGTSLLFTHLVAIDSFSPWLPSIFFPSVCYIYLQLLEYFALQMKSQMEASSSAQNINDTTQIEPDQYCDAISICRPENNNLERSLYSVNASRNTASAWQKRKRLLYQHQLAARKVSS